MLMSLNNCFMASEHSMDIVVQFDFQELKNAVEMAKKEIMNRYDLKDSKVEIELTEDMMKVNTATEYQIETVVGVIVSKMVNRKVSPKILDRQKIQPAGGMRFVQEIKLIKAMDQENAKNISKMIRDNFPKTKPLIQGDSVRVVSKSIDDLQAIMGFLNTQESIKIPLLYTNYR